MRPGDLDQQIHAEVAMLPLRDAAFLLWLKRWDLGRPDVMPPAAPAAGASTRIAQREIAHQSLAIDWLKRTHPTAGDDKIEEALKTAIGLYEKGHASFKDTGIFGHDIVSAAMQARAEYPGFQDATYQRLGDDIGRANR